MNTTESLDSYVSDFAYLNAVIDRLLEVEPELASVCGNHVRYDKLDLHRLCRGVGGKDSDIGGKDSVIGGKDSDIGGGNSGIASKDSGVGSDRLATLRLVYPLGPRALYTDHTGTHIQFVGFMGCNWEPVSGGVRERVWEADRALLRDLERGGHVLAYASGERPCGHWANLVLYSQPSFLGHWLRDVESHSKAVRALAPQFYKCVRIHTGVVRDWRHVAGAAVAGECGRQFVVQKTLHVAYCGGGEECAVVSGGVGEGDEEREYEERVRTRRTTYWSGNTGQGNTVTQRHIHSLTQHLTPDNMASLFPCVH